jgi:hypothetical protein
MSLDPISAALEIGNTIITRLFPDPTEAAKAKLELLKMQQDGDLAIMTAQTDINKIEAGSSNLFVSGWRPCVGWIGACALGYATILEPFARFISKVIFSYSGDFPIIDTTLTMQILLGLLGMAGLRSWDKKNGTAS